MVSRPTHTFSGQSSKQLTSMFLLMSTHVREMLLMNTPNMLEVLLMSNLNMFLWRFELRFYGPVNTLGSCQVGQFT